MSTAQRSRRSAVTSSSDATTSARVGAFAATQAAYSPSWACASVDVPSDADTTCCSTQCCTRRRSVLPFEVTGTGSVSGHTKTAAGRCAAESTTPARDSKTRRPSSADRASRGAAAAAAASSGSAGASVPSPPTPRNTPVSTKRPFSTVHTAMLSHSDVVGAPQTSRSISSMQTRRPSSFSWKSRRPPRRKPPPPAVSSMAEAMSPVGCRPLNGAPPW
mmetsp:Transcript_5771/g.18158  ORF Transcript_5771/g.18158 Transcript_5771/m.18158 type:complete len:218 (+) Transcript_5771:1249-1902(+)